MLLTLDRRSSAGTFTCAFVLSSRQGILIIGMNIRKQQSIKDGNTLCLLGTKVGLFPSKALSLPFDCFRAGDSAPRLSSASDRRRLFLVGFLGVA